MKEKIFLLLLSVLTLFGCGQPVRNATTTPKISNILKKTKGFPILADTVANVILFGEEHNSSEETQALVREAIVMAHDMGVKSILILEEGDSISVPVLLFEKDGMKVYSAGAETLKRFEGLPQDQTLLSKYEVSMRTIERTYFEDLWFRSMWGANDTSFASVLNKCIELDTVAADPTWLAYYNKVHKNFDKEANERIVEFGPLYDLIFLVPGYGHSFTIWNDYGYSMVIPQSVRKDGHWDQVLLVARSLGLIRNCPKIPYVK